MADVAVEAAPHPDREEDADHLLARDAPELLLLMLQRCRLFLFFSPARAAFAFDAAFFAPFDAGFGGISKELTQTR